VSGSLQSVVDDEVDGEPWKTPLLGLWPHMDSSLTRPLLVSKETKNDENAWAARVKKRDKGLCCMERRQGRLWVMCGRKGTDGAHIYRRHHCGKAKFVDSVGITSCRECHDNFDGRSSSYEVRVPAARRRAAYDTIAKVSKVMTIGDRP